MIISFCDRFSDVKICAKKRQIQEIYIPVDKIKLPLHRIMFILEYYQIWTRMYADVCEEIKNKLGRDLCLYDPEVKKIIKPEIELRENSV